MNSVLTAAALGMLLLDGIKSFWRRFVVKDATYDFPPKILALLLVVCNYVAVPVLAVLSVEGYEFPTDWLGWLRGLVVAMLTSLVSLSVYVTGYAPFKAYAQTFNLRKAVKAFEEKLEVAKSKTLKK